jgi:hypothetical protein
VSARVYSIACPPGLHPFGRENGHPRYRENQERARDKRGYALDTIDCCVVCGKGTVGGSTFVLLSDVGEYITAAEHRENGDLGEYPVGSDCARKLKAAGVPIVTRVPS